MKKIYEKLKLQIFKNFVIVLQNRISWVVLVYNIYKMSITDCKKVMREYLYEIDWLKEKIKDLENAIKVKDEYIEKLKKENKELQEYKWMYEDEMKGPLKTIWD